MSSPSFERIAAILGSFDFDNRPRFVSEILKETSIRSSTGYALVRAMVKAGLLERVDHGWIRLGKQARELAFSPMEGNYSEARSNKYAYFQQLERSGSHAAIMRAGIGWMPALAQSADTSRFAKPGPWKIGFANASLGNPWRHALLESLRYGVNVQQDRISSFEDRNAEESAIRQVEDIDYFVDKGFDGLIVSAADMHDVPLAERLAGLVADGIPVIALDRRPKNFDAFVSFVTASDAQIGHLSAIWLCEYLKSQGRIWMLSGADRASPAHRRQSAALAAFAEYPGIRIESVAFTGWTAEGGRSTILGLIEQFGHAPDGVWCDSGLQGVGSLQAFEEKGISPPPHTGGDLNLMYKKAIDMRLPFVAVDYPAAMGSLAIDTMVSVLSGLPVFARVETPIQIILPRGHETQTIRADRWAEQHVRWDQSDEVILSQGASLRPYRPAPVVQGRFK